MLLLSFERQWSWEHVPFYFYINVLISKRGAVSVKKVIVSAEDDLFKMNRIMNVDWAKKYPGASWINCLQVLMKGEFELATSDVALSHINTNFWNIQDLYIIQHGTDKNAEELINRGARPLILTCFESPLYIGSFYDNFQNASMKFPTKIVPNGLFLNQKSNENDFFYFPSFFQNELGIRRKDWAQRKLMSMVVSNKYVFEGHRDVELNLRYFIWWLKAKVIQTFLAKNFTSKTNLAHRVQLQDTRLEYIYFFKVKNALDLFGGGWGSLKNLPPKWQKRFFNLIDKSKNKKVDSKLDAIADYKFNLCIENAEFPGYITEKIIDAMVAKTIPVYMGAPDVEDFIPSNCFVNARKFKKLENLYEYLIQVSESEANTIIENGQTFLKSQEGNRYSYEGFSELIQKVVVSHGK